MKATHFLAVNAKYCACVENDIQNFTLPQSPVH